MDELPNSNAGAKKCPMCAEEIPLAAVTCEFCGAQFEVTSTGYCQTCHDVREADGNGRCKVCGNPVADLHLESRLIEEPAQKNSAVTQSVAQIEKTKTGKGRLPIGVLVGILAFVLLAVTIWLGRKGLPVVSDLFVTPTLTATPTIPPTITPVPSPTNTLEPTLVPSDIVVPSIEEMASSIPWLPLDKKAMPGVTWVSFNINKAPFDDPLVREAFAAALDRQVLAKIAEEHGIKNVRPATSLTPPETLGRDLYGQVGIPFNPERARTLLAQAGYTGGTNFPKVNIYTNPTEINTPVFEAIVQMWEKHLNIKVNLISIDEDYTNWLRNNDPDLFRQGWIADFNDPDNFLQVFHSGAGYNIPGFSNSKFNQLIDQAAKITDPAERQELYIQAERILCEDEIPIIPLYYFTVEE
jgi:hypothetical protein